VFSSPAAVAFLLENGVVLFSSRSVSGLAGHRGWPRRCQLSTDSNIWHFDQLSQKYPGRFHYLGYTSRSDVTLITQNAHIGFFLLRPDAPYWVKCSSNKIFEYLSCGVIPIIRADCCYSDDLASCSLLYDKTTSEDDIIKGVRELVDKPGLVKDMMAKAFSLHTKFSFESVQQRYLQLYHSLHNANP